MPFLRYGTKIKRTKSNQSLVTKTQITHKLGELPSYLKNKAHKNNYLLAKTKREFEVEKLKLCDAQTKIISLQKTYQDLQKNSTDKKDDHLDELKLIAFKYDNNNLLSILTKFNLNTENTKIFTKGNNKKLFLVILLINKSITKGFYDEIMRVIEEKLMNFLNLNLQNYNEILLDISQILDNVKVVTN